MYGNDGDRHHSCTGPVQDLHCSCIETDQDLCYQIPGPDQDFCCSCIGPGIIRAFVVDVQGLA